MQPLHLQQQHRSTTNAASAQGISNYTAVNQHPLTRHAASAPIQQQHTLTTPAASAQALDNNSTYSKCISSNNTQIQGTYSNSTKTTAPTASAPSDKQQKCVLEKIYHFYHCSVYQAGSICIKHLKLKSIQFVENSFCQKKNWKDIFKIFFCTTGLRICMDLRIFGSFLYPTLFKICSQKFDRKQFYLTTLNFVIICIAKK